MKVSVTVLVVTSLMHSVFSAAPLLGVPLSPVLTVSCTKSADCIDNSRLASSPSPFPWTAAPSSVEVSCDELIISSGGFGVCFPVGAPNEDAEEPFLLQEIDGFGGSFLRSGAILLNKLSASRQDQLLRLLFDPTEGSGFSIGKVPIAATDFMPPAFCEKCDVPSWYSYEEEPGNFSVLHDAEQAGGTIPFILRAQQYAKETKILLESCMDFPPTWMLNSSTPLVPTPNPNDIPQTRVNHSHFSDLAFYFLKFTEAFKSYGVDIAYLSMFNEPAQSYCYVDRDDLYHLLTEHVGPLFRSTPGAPNLTWGEQFGRLITEQMYPELMNRPGVKNYTDILFYHGYDCGSGNQSGWICSETPLGNNCTCPGLQEAMTAIANYKQQFPEYKMWLTELCYATEYGDYPPPGNGCLPLPRLDFMDGMQWGRMIFGDLSAGASGWIYWNILLDPIGGPYLLSPTHNDPVGNNQQPLIVVDYENDVFYPTACFYVLSHFSKFLRRGTRRIAINRTLALPPNVYTLAFVSTSKIGQKEYIVQLMNDRQDAVNVTLWFSNFTTVVPLPAVSIMTVTFSVATTTSVENSAIPLPEILGLAGGGILCVLGAFFLLRWIWSDEKTNNTPSRSTFGATTRYATLN
jgi:glucosylceramidase